MTQNTENIHDAQRDNSEPETLFCDQCGNETHDDHSMVWESAWDNSGELSRVCYDCAPPDYEYDPFDRG